MSLHTTIGGRVADDMPNDAIAAALRLLDLARKCKAAIDAAVAAAERADTAHRELTAAESVRRAAAAQLAAALDEVQP